MVMHTQNELLGMILSNKSPEILSQDRETNYFLPAERDQQLDLADIFDQANNEELLFDNMDNLIDDNCYQPEEVIVESTETPSTTTSDSGSSSLVTSTSETQFFFQFPVTQDSNEFTTIDLGYITELNDTNNTVYMDDITTSNDLTDSESVYSTTQSTPFSPTSPSFSLPPPTPDTASSTSSNVPSVVKEELKMAIKMKRLREGKGDLKVEFVEPLPEQLTEEEELKRIEKREKNKMAAQKCREKKRILAEKLEAETRQLQKTQNKYKLEIQKLLDEREQLLELVKIHKTVCPRFRTKSLNI